MATKGIKVLECRFEAGYVHARIAVTDAKISTGETKEDQSMRVSYTLIVQNLLEDVLGDFAATQKINLANIRKQGIEAIAKLDGMEILVSDIPAMVAVKGTKKTSLDMLMETFKLTRDQALEVQKDPTLIKQYL